MPFGILIELLTALASLAGGSLLINSQVDKAVKLVFERMGLIPKKEELPYAKKLENLTNSMLKASKEMDSLLVEFAHTTNERKEAMEKVEAELSALLDRQKELQERVDQLKDIPIPVAQEFAKLTRSGEKRSARRDYALFGAGVIVSTGIAILLRVLGLG